MNFFDRFLKADKMEFSLRIKMENNHRTMSYTFIKMSGYRL